jgi:hypothetical protein
VKASRARARAPERVSELARHVARSRHGNRRRVVAITGRAPGLSGRTVDDSQTHRWRKQDSNSWSPQQTTLSRSSSFPNPAFLFRPETATRSQEGPAVRIPFAPGESPQTIGSAGDFTRLIPIIRNHAGSIVNSWATAWSAGFRNAPTRGPIRALADRCPAMASCRSSICATPRSSGIANFAIELDLACACRWWRGSPPTPECTSHSEISPWTAGRALSP